ncbi:MAG: ParA family protein [Lentisphaerae bacterium]|nr:ParA family protein [Lentisphaerota bacterium]
MKKTIVVALANQKGGVGKTTTAVNFSACLAEKRKKVLLVDLDPQANATSGLGVEKGASVFSAMLGESGCQELIQKTGIKGLDIIPSEIDLAGSEVAIARYDDYLHRLRDAMEPVIESGVYDFIIFDCPPSLGILFMNALNTADEVIIPIQCEYFALEGLGVMVDIVNQIRDAGNPQLHISGILMTMYNLSTNLSQQVVQEVRTHFGKNVFDTLIPRNVRLSEAPSYGQPIIQYDSNCVGAIAYRTLAKEFLKRQKQSVPDEPGESSLYNLVPADLAEEL